MVWDVSENIAIYANATYAQETQSTYLANGISTITSITSAPLITDQNVELNIGWKANFSLEESLLSAWKWEENLNQLKK